MTMSNKAEKIGVLGAGTMGAGIAQVVAQGLWDAPCDIKQEFIDAGSVASAPFSKEARKGKISAEEQQILDRLHSTTKLEICRLPP
jgi:3-hydroxybutyryl-CoA dehydrogenase